MNLFNENFSIFTLLLMSVLFTPTFVEAGSNTKHQNTKYTAITASINISQEEQYIIDQVEINFTEQVKLLAKSVNINSGTRNLLGVKKIGKFYQKEFSNISLHTEWVDLPKKMQRAGHLIARTSESTDPNAVNILLIGHLDTVFPIDSAFQAFTQEENIAKGPGVTDMKDGNSIIIYALKALKNSNIFEKSNIRVIFNGDEESVGRPVLKSREAMIELAKKSDYALSFETGGIDYATIARRGTSSWNLEVSGRRSHSSGIFSNKSGAGAIFESARILNQFYNDLRKEVGLTFSPGVIAGGTEVKQLTTSSMYSSRGKSNVIPQVVKIKGDMRFISNQQREQTKEKMYAIVKENLPVTSAKIKFHDGYPAMIATEGNKKLLQQFSQISEDLGYGTVQALPARKRGAGDISFIADYVDSLDGLGAKGGGSHTPQEFLDLDSLKMATKRTALLIYRLANRINQ